MPSGIYLRTEYHRKINSDSHKGISPWNKGTKGLCKPNSTSFKVGEIHPRTPHSEATKLKISGSKIGKPINRIKGVSLETREKIRQTLREGKYVKCISCEKMFYISPSSQQKYCNKECSRDATRKEKNINWKGGISRGYKTGYHSKEYKDWRKEVFIRDNFTCQGCGLYGGYLTVHHIKSFAHYPDLRFDINNGITLCEICHSNTDNYKGLNKKKVKTNEMAMAL